MAKPRDVFLRVNNLLAKVVGFQARGGRARKEGFKVLFWNNSKCRWASTHTVVPETDNINTSVSHGEVERITTRCKPSKRWR